MKTKGQKRATPPNANAVKKGKTNKGTSMTEDENDKNLKEPLPGNSKGEERNKQRKKLKSDARNSPDNPDKQESNDIRRKIHSSPGSDTEPMK